ncbi:MAG: AsnC family transcriptional regulator [bacterium]
MDKIDRKILYELDLNSRQSFQALGRKVGLGKETAFHRVQKLKEKEIIDKFITILNVHELGYQNYRFFLKLKNVDSKIEDKIIKFFKDLKSTGWVISIEGYWNLGVWFMVEDFYSFKENYKNFKTKFSNFIADEKLSIFSDVQYFSRSYLVSKDNHQVLEVKVPKEKQKISETELKIIEKLAENSRTPILEISAHAGISPKTTIKKIKELEKRKIILGYRLKINLEQLGIRYYKLHFKLNNLTEKDRDEIKQFITKNPNIIYLDETISGYDLELDVQIENKQDLDNLIENLKQKFKRNIESYDVLEFIKEHKHIFLISPSPKQNMINL